MERLLKFLLKLWNRAQPGLKRAFLLPPKVIAVLVPTTMVLCIAALNTQGKHPVLEMLIYLASAYALAVLGAGLGSITEAAARLLHGSRVYRWAQSNTIARLFISDFRFRGELSLYQGLAVSTLFAVFKGVTAVLYRSAWLGAVAVYYISFGVTRLLLVRSWRASQKLESEDSSDGVIGGGSKNALLNRFTAASIGLPVVAGPSEATAVGNLMIQARAAGCVTTLREMRALIARCIPTERFTPHHYASWDEAYDRFRRLTNNPE